MNETLEKILEYLEKIKEYSKRIEVMTAWYMEKKKILVQYAGDKKVYELIDSPSWDWSKARYFVA